MTAPDPSGDGAKRNDRGAAANLTCRGYWLLIYMALQQNKMIKWKVLRQRNI